MPAVCHDCEGADCCILLFKQHPASRSCNALTPQGLVAIKLVASTGEQSLSIFLFAVSHGLG